MNKDRLAELRNQTIGFIFQFHYLLSEFTALENVLMPYLIQKQRPCKKVIERADESTGNLDSGSSENVCLD